MIGKQHKEKIKRFHKKIYISSYQMILYLILTI